jgi:hypothetical protein
LLDQVFACLIHHTSVKYKGNEFTNKISAKVVIEKLVEPSSDIMEQKKHDHREGKDFLEQQLHKHVFKAFEEKNTKTLLLLKEQKQTKRQI